MIVEGEKIELYTTKTINESYKRKMNAITGLNIEEFYHFIPVSIGGPTKILGASFEFDYAFHTVSFIYLSRSISLSITQSFSFTPSSRSLQFVLFFITQGNLSAILEIPITTQR